MTEAMELRYGTPAEAGMLSDRMERIKAVGPRSIENGVHTAVVMLAARRGVIFLHEAYGQLRPEADSPPVVLDTIFPLASMTKPITGTAAMLLVEDGLLGLNRPVADYIPELCGEGTDALLVHHLMTHTSGYTNGALFGHTRAKLRELREGATLPPRDETQHPSIHEQLVLRYDAPLSKPPGEIMSYCNFNVILLGEIIRRVSGCSLADFARERIFDPLGMDDSTYIVPEEMRPRIVKRPPDAFFTQGAGRYMPGIDSREREVRPMADTGAYSTAHDLAVFGQTFLNGGSYGETRLLSRAAVTEMTRNQIPGIAVDLLGSSYPEASWGFQWGVHGNGKFRYLDGSLHSPEAFSHSGAGGAFIWVDPAYEIVGVYLSVVLRGTPEGANIWDNDLFQNAVTAAIAN